MQQPRSGDKTLCRALKLSQKQLPRIAFLPETATAMNNRGTLPLKNGSGSTVIGDGAAGKRRIRRGR